MDDVKQEIKSEVEQKIKTPTIWGIANALVEKGYYERTVNFSEQVYKKLYDQCLELDLDLSLVLRYLYTIDSDLVKEEEKDLGVQSKGVLSDTKNK